MTAKPYDLDGGPVTRWRDYMAGRGFLELDYVRITACTHQSGVTREGKGIG
jgi:hypothetical protein